MTDRESQLIAALRWLLDDLTDAGENKREDSDEEYDSVAYAREVCERAEREVSKR
jgi:hypothetical protein